MNSPSRRPLSRIYYKLVRRFVSRTSELPPTESMRHQPIELRHSFTVLPRIDCGKSDKLVGVPVHYPGVIVLGIRQITSRGFGVYGQQYTQKVLLTVFFSHLFHVIREPLQAEIVPEGLLQVCGR